MAYASWSSRRYRLPEIKDLPVHGAASPMHQSPAHTDSAYFVHRRYEDTALVIFRQNQKKKGQTSEDHYVALPHFSPNRALQQTPPLYQEHPLLRPDPKADGGHASPSRDHSLNRGDQRSPTARDISEKYRNIPKTPESSPEKSLSSSPESSGKPSPVKSERNASPNSRSNFPQSFGDTPNSSLHRRESLGSETNAAVLPVSEESSSVDPIGAEGDHDEVTSF